MRRKLKSVKLWLVAFCCATIAYIVVADKAEFLPLAEKLTFPIFAYIPANVWQKKKSGEPQ